MCWLLAKGMHFGWEVEFPFAMWVSELGNRRDMRGLWNGEQSEAQECYREKQNLTTCWICFFHFNRCFQFILFTKKILSIHNSLPGGTLPLCLNIKPLFVPLIQDLIHLWMAAGKKKLIHPSLTLAIPGDNCKINSLFTLLPHLPPSLLYKRIWHLDPNKMVILRY